jgi:hypothetical protein
MKDEEHTTGVGNIVTNLQALESVLRGFLVERFGQCAGFPKIGDKLACRNYLTSWISLGDLIDDYYASLSENEKQYSIDKTVVTIRDALAHGRLFVRGANPTPPFELWKFGKATGGKMPVEFCETLAAEWLKSTWLLIDREQQKVVTCSRGRGYKLLR